MRKEDKMAKMYIMGKYTEKASEIKFNKISDLSPVPYKSLYGTTIIFLLPNIPLKSFLNDKLLEVMISLFFVISDLQSVNHQIKVLELLC